MFEKIKAKWNERIQRNAFKSKLEYVNREGIKLMNHGTLEENLPAHVKVQEEVYFKRSMLPLGDWKRIYPPIKENGKVHLVNLIFGGWRNLVWLLLTLGIIAMLIMQFINDWTVIETLRSANEICDINLGF